MSPPQFAVGNIPRLAVSPLAGRYDKDHPSPKRTSGPKAIADYVWAFLWNKRAEMSLLMANIDLLSTKGSGIGAAFQPLFDSVTGGSRCALLLLIGAVGIFSSICTSNNTSLTRL